MLCLRLSLSRGVHENHDEVWRTGDLGVGGGIIRADGEERHFGGFVAVNVIEGRDPWELWSTSRLRLQTQLYS